MQETKFEIGEKTYVIKPPKAKLVTEAQAVYTKSFAEAVKKGAILKKALEDHMRQQGLWDDQKQEEYISIIKKQAEIEYKIKSKQITKATEAAEKAIELKKLRVRLNTLLADTNSMDTLTAEGIAEQDRFNFLVANSVFYYDTQKLVFSSLEEYLEKSETNEAIQCASKFASFIYGVEDGYENAFLENKVLKRLNLLDDKGNLLNKDGKRVDYDGNLLNENGARVDKNGVRIDINNNPVIDDAIVDSLEFENDLGQQVEEEVKKTRARKKE